MSLGWLGVAPAQAFPWQSKLCLGFGACNSAGYGNAGYQNEYLSSHLSMYAGHNCTNYAAYRLIKNGINASYLGDWGVYRAAGVANGNAENWGTIARFKGVAVDMSPRVGDILWLNSSMSPDGGHVAYVERVDLAAGKVIASEDAWGGDFSWRPYLISSVAGFIHFGGAPSGADKPGVPTVSGSTSGSPQLAVSWNAPNDNGSPITHYDVVDNQGNYCGGIGANTRSITFPGGPCIYGKDFTPIVGLGYQFQVRAYNGVGSVDGVSGVSPWSDPSVAVVPLKSTVDPVVRPGTGHWYQVVYGITKWSDALSGAKARNYQGMVGHLATVTSQSEFDFIRSLEPNARLWLGARDTGPSGGAARTWTWIDGPEKGDTFTTCVQSTVSTSCKAIANSFTKWLPNQPDNYTPGEPFLELSQNGWNDCFDLCASGVVGYVVEYEPISTSVSVSLPSRGTAGVKFSLTGKVNPSVSAGKVQLVWKFKINGKYVDVETTSVSVSQGKFTVSKVLKQKGAWQVTAQYLGSGVAPVYQASKPVTDSIILS